MKLIFLLFLQILNKEFLDFFTDSDAIFKNPRKFFYHINLNKEKVDSFKLCSLTEDYNLKEHSIQHGYYLLKIFKELNCQHDQDMLIQQAQQNLTSSNLLIQYYSFKTLMDSNTPFVSINICSQLDQYKSINGQFKLQKDNDVSESNYFLSSITLELLIICSQSHNMNFTPDKLIQELVENLQHVTKTTKAWFHEKFTFYTTTRLLRFIIIYNYQSLDESNFFYLMNYIYKYKTYDMNYQEQWEYQQLIKQLNKEEILTCKLPEEINLSKFDKKCKIKLNQFSNGMKALLKINNQEHKVNINKTGEIIFEKELIKNSEHFDIIIESQKRVFQPTTRVIVKKLNELTLIRAVINDSINYDGLIDSDFNQCGVIAFNAHKHNFLHVGFNTEHSSNFMFVQLKSFKKIENSSPVWAKWDSQIGLYVASFDLKDYDILLPNSDNYHIVIIMDSRKNTYQETYCGKMFINFQTNKIYQREKLNKPFEQEFTSHVNVPLPKGTSNYVVIYALVLLFSVVSLILKMMINYNIPIYVFKTNYSQVLFISSILLTFSTIIYLTISMTLLEKFWIIVIEFLLFLFIYSKYI